MEDPCKFTITELSRLAYPQSQAGLLGNTTTQQQHETCPQRIKQGWQEAHIPPSELRKLMIPRTCALWIYKKQ